MDQKELGLKGFAAAFSALEEKIQSADQSLIASRFEGVSLGLFEGKAGLCLYFYALGRKTGERRYKQIAHELLNDVFSRAPEIRSIRLQDGLAGIGWAIRRLIRDEYVRGAPNSILSDVDDRIFKELGSPQAVGKNDPLAQIHLLFYLVPRLEDQKKGSEAEWIYRESVIETLNSVYQRHAAAICQIPPPYYNTDYLLPQFLAGLSKVYRQGFYNERISKIVEEMSPSVLSVFPLLDAYKLFLLWGMDRIPPEIRPPGWNLHMTRLRKAIDRETIFDEELRNRNLFFRDGIGSLYPMVSALEPFFTLKEREVWKRGVIKKAEHSDQWPLLLSDPYYLQQHAGLVNGYSGISWLLRAL